MLLRAEMTAPPEPQSAKNAHPLRLPQKMRNLLPLTVALALLGFAANSLLCRLALAPPARSDALGFTVLRLAAGAVMLLLLSGLRRARAGASPAGALALLVYMLAFSAAYVRIGASLGALLLFASVQATMLGVALARGERLGLRTWLGLLSALSGLAWLLAPGVGAPSPLGGGLMLIAGVAWGVYSLLGRRTGDALGTTAGNFVAATLLLLLALTLVAGLRGLLPGLLPADWRVTTEAMTVAGAALAVASGALASGLGYALWYRALPRLGASRAAIVQLVVPVLAAALSLPLLGETLRLRLVLAGAWVLAGVALALARPPRAP